MSLRIGAMHRRAAHESATLIGCPDPGPTLHHFHLNVSAFYGTGGAFRDCLGGDGGVFGGV